MNHQKLGKLESTIVVVAEELDGELVADAGLEIGAFGDLLLLRFVSILMIWRVWGWFAYLFSVLFDGTLSGCGLRLGQVDSENVRRVRSVTRKLVDFLVLYDVSDWYGIASG